MRKTQKLIATLCEAQVFVIVLIAMLAVLCYKPVIASAYTDTCSLQGCQTSEPQPAFQPNQQQTHKADKDAWNKVYNLATVLPAPAFLPQFKLRPGPLKLLRTTAEYKAVWLPNIRGTNLAYAGRKKPKLVCVVAPSPQPIRIFRVTHRSVTALRG